MYYGQEENVLWKIEQAITTSTVSWTQCWESCTPTSRSSLRSCGVSPLHIWSTNYTVSPMRRFTQETWCLWTSWRNTSVSLIRWWTVRCSSLLIRRYGTWTVKSLLWESTTLSRTASNQVTFFEGTPSGVPSFFTFLLLIYQI